MNKNIKEQSYDTKKYIQYTYKELIIYHNFEGSRFNTDYWSIYNPSNKCHTHCRSKKLAYKIVDCYNSFKKCNVEYYRFGRHIKNMALRLDGLYILSR